MSREVTLRLVITDHLIQLEHGCNIVLSYDRAYSLGAVMEFLNCALFKEVLPEEEGKADSKE